MLIPDVNVLLSAFREDAADHDAALAWLDASADGLDTLGVSGLVLSAVVRIATNHRVYSPASRPERALEFCQAVREFPAVTELVPGPRHWGLFDGLCRTVHARANVVPDAYLAALALENGATFVTRDRGFARFPGLRLLDPFRT